LKKGFWSLFTMKRAEVVVNSLWTWDLLYRASLLVLAVGAGDSGLHKGTLLASSGTENLVQSRKAAL